MRLQLGFIALLSVMLAACSSAPKRPQTSAISPQLMQKYARQTLKTPLTLPVKGVAPKQLRDTWGAARSGGRRHEGIDIMADKGTKVLSATPGIIRDMRETPIGGKVIWIYGPQGSWHYYAHLSGFKRGLEVGDQVDAADVIGYVGNTGNARGGAHHLHYGIYLTAKGVGAVNPYAYLR